MGPTERTVVGDCGLEDGWDGGGEYSVTALHTSGAYGAQGTALHRILAYIQLLLCLRECAHVGQILDLSRPSGPRRAPMQLALDHSLPASQFK